MTEHRTDLDDLDGIPDSTRDFVRAQALEKRVPFRSILALIFQGMTADEIRALPVEVIGRRAAIKTPELADKVKPNACQMPEGYAERHGKPGAGSRARHNAARAERFGKPLRELVRMGDAI